MQTRSHHHARDVLGSRAATWRNLASEIGRALASLPAAYLAMLRPSSAGSALSLGAPCSVRSVALTAVATAIALHAVAAAARIATSTIAPVPAATMGPIHRSAEIAVAIVAPASRFSGAELWNVSRAAGRTENRGADAVLAFGGGVLRLTLAPWTRSIEVEPHPQAEWNAPRIELTPSLPPLLPRLAWPLLVCGGPACALGVLVVRRVVSGTPSTRAVALNAVTRSLPVAVGLGALGFVLTSLVAAGIAAPRTAVLVAALGSAGILVGWMRAIDRALRGA